MWESEREKGVRERGGRGFCFFFGHKGNVRADLHKVSTNLAAVPLSLYFSPPVYLISRFLHGYTLKETWSWWYCVIDEM